jgi:hypothetical protein
MTYLARWLREWEEWVAEGKQGSYFFQKPKAKRRWQAWCPFCEQDTEHAYPSHVSQKDHNTNVLCVRCYCLHAGRAKRPQSN